MVLNDIMCTHATIYRATKLLLLLLLLYEVVNRASGQQWGPAVKKRQFGVQALEFLFCVPP